MCLKSERDLFNQLGGAKACFIQAQSASVCRREARDEGMQTSCECKDKIGSWWLIGFQFFSCGAYLYGDGRGALFLLPFGCVETIHHDERSCRKRCGG